MGLLDEAIREHLDLKRARGADPTEIERLEREALGPVRREPLMRDAHPAAQAQQAHDAFATHQVGDPGGTAYHDDVPAHWAEEENLEQHHPQPGLVDQMEAPAPERPKRRRFLRRSRAAPAPSPDQSHDTVAPQDWPEQAHGDPYAGTPYPERPERPHFGEHPAGQEPSHGAGAGQQFGLADVQVPPDPIAHAPLYEGEPATELHHAPGQLSDLPADSAPHAGYSARHEQQPPADQGPWQPSLGPEPQGRPGSTPAAPEADEPPHAPAANPPHLQLGQSPRQPSQGAADDPAGVQAPQDQGHGTPEPAAQPPRPDELQRTTEFDVQANFTRESEAADEDMLEETPDFLQDAPEHDRLWFEQRPPRDFDFDG